jgi:segregation and condensation protein A
MSAYQVKLPVFEGPFDLLYHLIEEQKINIYDIPIAHITNQYLEYLQIIEILDMEIASSFLIMAATLLEIKSKMLLPKEREQEVYDDNYEDYLEDGYEGEDARLGLVEKLVEYKKFKLIALELRKLEAESSRIYTRFTVSERRPEEILEINIGALDLLNIYHALIKSRVSPPVHRVVVDRIGLEDRIIEIRRYLKSFKKEITFEDLIKDPTNLESRVVSFMAVLEMIKAGELDFMQEDSFAPIILSKPSKNPSLSVAAANT